MSSVKSATGLLSQPQVQPYSLPIGRLASPSPSTPSQSSFVSRTVAKKLFVVNTDVASVSSDTATRSLRGQQLRRGVSYGAMGSPAHPRPVDRLSIPTAPSTFSGTSVATPLATAIPSTAFTRRPSVAPSVTPKQTEEGNASRAPQRSPLLGVNPFTDSPSRNPSPESFYSQLSMRSAPANLDMGNAYNPFSRTYGEYLTPYFSYSSNGSLVSIPPQLNPGKFPTGRLSNPSIPFMASSQSSLTSYPGTPFSTPALTLSNTSVHSLAPSVHFAGHHTPPDVPVDIASREPSPYAPPATYMRPGSDDPLWRAGGARPRANGGSTGMPYQGDVRRYWSMPGSQSGSPSAGAGYGAPGHRYLAAPTQPGYGYAGQVRQGPPPMVMYPARMANGVGGPKDASWREMVMRAASS
ncbi:hypothetical protein GSI_03853 [Ganoderma sinense ZZ0214-1]|uniref:Uncharacterized protein n=1 Tax=Ganoderma sinense ZZ0214-1 TaxID=1077348 RepID=A0A2G8SK62_9APHY|nr:hypothetical protein GSI_03853 [Ganoderma sinense ZZ0214-1]